MPELTETIVEPVVETPVVETPAVSPDLQKEIDNSIKLRHRAQAAEKALEEANKNAMPADDVSALAEFRKQAEDNATKKLQDEGQYEELLGKKQEAYDTAIATETARADAAFAALKRTAVEGPIMAALAAKGVKDVANAAFLLQGRFDQKADAELVDGLAVVKVRDSNGSLVQDADCDKDDSISVPQLVDNWLATDAGQNFLPASGDSGSGVHKGGAAKKTDALLLAELDGSADKMAAYIKENGPDAFVKLAGDVRRQKKT